MDIDHELALVARIVAEETVSRAASQLSLAMHRDENAFEREEMNAQTCEREKSKREVRVAKDLDAEVLRLGIMSPATPQVIFCVRNFNFIQTIKSRRTDIVVPVSSHSLLHVG